MKNSGGICLAEGGDELLQRRDLITDLPPASLGFHLASRIHRLSFLTVSAAAVAFRPLLARASELVEMEGGEEAMDPGDRGEAADPTLSLCGWRPLFRYRWIHCWRSLIVLGGFFTAVESDSEARSKRAAEFHGGVRVHAGQLKIHHVLEEQCSASPTIVGRIRLQNGSGGGLVEFIRWMLDMATQDAVCWSC